MGRGVGVFVTSVCRTSAECVPRAWFSGPEPASWLGCVQKLMSGKALLHTPVDVRVAQLAGRQEGMISTAQLVGLGIRRSGIHERVRRGWLHPYCRGVYSVGHARVVGRARLWAAILACGGPPLAVLSHRTAAALSDLDPDADRSRRPTHPAAARKGPAPSRAPAGPRRDRHPRPARLPTRSPFPRPPPSAREPGPRPAGHPQRGASRTASSP